jgi:hypothetical protein
MNLEGNERDRNLLLPFFHLLMNCCLVIFSVSFYCFFFFFSFFSEKEKKKSIERTEVMGTSRAERKLEGPPTFLKRRKVAAITGL